MTPPVRMRRSTPCEVRRPGELRWRPHMCSINSVLTDRLPYNATPRWLFASDGWEVRVAPHLLDREFPATAESDTWCVGATGTRAGAAAEQLAALRAHLREWLVYAPDLPTLHHGGCVGADRQAHNAFRETWGKLVRIVVHPASDQPESLCDWSDADEVRDPLPSLVRNRNIAAAVSEGSVLLALPAGPARTRSGTWSTVRWAEKAKRGVVLFLPEGAER